MSKQHLQTLLSPLPANCRGKGEAKWAITQFPGLGKIKSILI